jgi:hypothetical protein
MNGQLLTGSFTYAQGRDAMLAFMEHRNFAQHPQLLPAIAEDPQNIGANLLFTAATAPAPSAATSTAAVTRANTVRVALETVSPALQAKIAALPGVTIVDRGGDLTVRQSTTQVQLLGPAGDPILASGAGDPNLTKRIAAQAWLNRVLPTASGGAGLRAETNPGSRGNTFVQCESFVFEVRLDKPAYVMLLDLDPQGGFTVLYPTRPSERGLVASGAARAIPSNDPKDRILVTPPFGSDAVTVLAFEQAPAFFSDLSGAPRFDLDSKLANELAVGLTAVRGSVGIQRIAVNTYAGNSKISCGT